MPELTRKLPTGKKKSKQTLKAEEAIAAIGLVAMASDTEIEEIEAEMLLDILAEIDVFESYSEDDFQEMLDKITRIAEEDGIDALLNTSVVALTNDNLREAALMTGMLVVAADGDILDDEEEYLAALQKRLGVSDEKYNEIIDELFMDEDEEEEED